MRAFFLLTCLVLSCKTVSENRRHVHTGTRNTDLPVETTAETINPATGPDAVKTPAPDFAFDPAQATRPYTPPGHQTATEGNPFANVNLLVNPIFTQAVDFSASKAPILAERIKIYRDKPTAIWLDTIARVEQVLEPALKLAQMQQRNGPKVLVTLVIYDLPNRDCFANASNGELLADELNRYQTEYIDRIRQGLVAYPDVPVVAILEPDSLPNLVTNIGMLRCDAVRTPGLYKSGVSYAIQNLKLPHVSLYLDLAHAGWLGWVFKDDTDNVQRRQNLVKILREVIGAADVRGFVTNVANYTPLKESANVARSASYYQFNEVHDEYTYVAQLAALFKLENLPAHFIIDSGRSGNPMARSDWSNWCNVKDTGIGALPAVAPLMDIDAFLWVKPPGESDGVSDASAKRFDSRCQSIDSLRGAPEAGQWFHEHFLGLVQNAQTGQP